MPSITAVITTYNLEKHIENCFHDLLGQTFTDFDVAVVDDCSTDGTPAVIKAYGKRYPERIRALFLERNTGSPARARNAALDSGLIDGGYVVFLDGDDRLEPDFLETLWNSAQRSRAQIAVCAYDRVEETSGHVLCEEMKGFPPVIEIPPGDDVLAFVNGALWNKLIQTSVIGSLRIPDFKVGEDLCFGQALFRRCSRLSMTDRILIHYQVHASSVISNTQEETIHRFAAEFAALKDAAPDAAIRNTVALTAFIHIGISMAIRACDNKSIALGRHLAWTRRYFRENFGMLSGFSFLTLRSLKRHGLKGVAIWVCKVLYQIGCFRVFLVLYRAAVKLLHADFKF